MELTTSFQGDLLCGFRIETTEDLKKPQKHLGVDQT
jgi:hypothetical protein